MPALLCGVLAVVACPRGVATAALQSAASRGLWRLSGHVLADLRPTPSLPQVIRQLVDHMRHRVYVVDDIGRAQGVITPTDVLRMITG